MPGAGRLLEIYGFWPTMHDAHVTSVQFDTAGVLRMRFYYYDGAAAGGEDTHCLIDMVWSDVRSFRHRFENNRLDGMQFAHVGGSLRTYLHDQCQGTVGEIVSGGVEVVRVEQPVEEYRDASQQPQEIDGFWLTLHGR